ncbi:MAG: hypothetical protein CMF69_04660 [Magnetovibrio sp.]|nr:hypothetical protein [Magnetovibrio sp.]
MQVSAPIILLFNYSIQSFISILKRKIEIKYFKINIIKMSPSFEFTHENQTIHNFINTLITNEKNFFNLQLLLMSGIKLNNVPLMEYAIEFDKNIVHTPVPSNVTNLIDNIFNNEESQNTEDISPQ